VLGSAAGVVVPALVFTITAQLSRSKLAVEPHHDADRKAHRDVNAEPNSTFPPCDPLWPQRPYHLINDTFKHSTASAATMTLFEREDHETVSWSLKEFSIGKDFKWSKSEEEDVRTELFVDRATHEFGIVYYNSQSIAAVEQFPDTEEPVYFEAKTARAACKHDICGKVTVLFEHVQLNLKFESTGALGSEDHVSATTHAHSFVNAVEVLAGAAQSKTFRIHTVIAKGFDKNDDFDMVARGYTERVVESWMSQSTGSSHWSESVLLLTGLTITDNVRVRDSGEWSDFTIVAGTTPFPVHRVK
jgi:histone acetyltransferase HTATIP